MPSSVSSIHIRRAASLTIGWGNLLNLVEALLEPLVMVFSLWSVAAFREGEITPPYLILSLIVFSLTFPGSARLKLTVWQSVRNIVFRWIGIAALLLFFGYASRYIKQFDPEVLITWAWVAPVSLVAGHLFFRVAAPYILHLQSPPKRVVIVGMNEQGIALAERIAGDRYANMILLGFFDDRAPERLAKHSEYNLLGRFADLSSYAKEERVHVIYMSLPMTTQPRILRLLDDLRDTTASIYFVPDLFVTDLIQGRMDMVCGMPVVAVCESPFMGTNGLVKRVSDVVLSLLILILISPVLLFIAIAVKLTSPGPVIFKQRRYGLEGEEIIVYKFRSMTVTEDGGSIRQAQKNDQRVTPLGAFLRKSSLDELPQFFNVLQGRMSIVGPRPHAVAHNEMYRKLIKGYMVRHKVKPGITGWAQVNGMRGETETLEKMKARIDFDLDYLRNWSVRLDLYIILKTVLVVFKDQNAY